MMRPLNRVPYIGPAQAFQTYTISSPLRTHYKRIRCEMVPGPGCHWHQKGFEISTDTSTDIGIARAQYLTRHAGRRFTRIDIPGSTVVVFQFPAGQQCFTEHYLPLEREAFYSTRIGDDRIPGTPGNRRLWTRDDWLDNFANHQNMVAERRKAG